MEGAPAPPAVSLPRRGRTELGAAAADLGQPTDAPRVPFGRSSFCPHPSQPATGTPAPRRAAPRRRSPLPGSALLPTAGGFAGRGSRLSAAGRAAGAVKPGEPFRVNARSAGSGDGPALPGLRAARAGGGNLPGARRRARAAGRARPRPRASFLPRRARRPSSRCRSPELAARRRRSAGSTPPAPRRALPRAVSPPASQPPAPLFRALRTAGEAARSPAEAPPAARRPAPALAGLTRALKAPRPPRRALTPPLCQRWPRAGVSGARVGRRGFGHNVYK